jgi:hypothetical protein
MTPNEEVAMVKREKEQWYETSDSLLTMEAYKLNSLSASRLLALQDGGGELIVLKVRFLPP